MIIPSDLLKWLGIFQVPINGNTPPPAGVLLAANNLNDVADTPTSRFNLALWNSHNFSSSVNFNIPNPLGNGIVSIEITSGANGTIFTLPSMSVNDPDSSDRGTVFMILCDPAGNTLQLNYPSGATLLNVMQPGQFVILSLLNKNTTPNGGLALVFNSDDTALSPHIVGTDPTKYVYTKIQDAMDAAGAIASPTSMPVVIVTPGTYPDAWTWAPNVALWCLSPPKNNLQLTTAIDLNTNCAVNITGQVTINFTGTADSLSCEGGRFINLFIEQVTDSQSNLEFNNIVLDSTSAQALQINAINAQNITFNQCNFIPGHGVKQFDINPGSGFIGSNINFINCISMDFADSLPSTIGPAGGDASIVSIEGGVFIHPITTSCEIFINNAKIGTYSNNPIVNATSLSATIFITECTIHAFGGSSYWLLNSSGTTPTISVGNIVSLLPALGGGSSLSIDPTFVSVPPQYIASEVSLATGTFTPTLTGATTAGTTTYVAQGGAYTKLGNQVFCTVNITISAATGTGDVVIGNLPFPANVTGLTNPEAAIVSAASPWAWPASTSQLVGFVVPSTSTAKIKGNGSGVVGGNLQMANGAATFDLELIYTSA